MARRKVLQGCRDLVQSITVSYPNQETDPLLLKLQHGKLEHLFNDRDVGWTLIVPTEEEEGSTVPVSRLSQLQFRLSNMKWGHCYGPLHGEQPAFDGVRLILRFGSGISAVFIVDQSWNDVDFRTLQVNPSHYVYHQLMASPVQGAAGNNNWTMVQRGHDPHPELANLTMCLVFIHIGMTKVLTKRLDALGIVPVLEEDDSDDSEE
jgi:hypothetical protein